MIFKRKRPGGLSCRDVGKNLQSYLDRETVEPLSVSQLEQHLELCRQCGLEAEVYRSIKESLARAGRAQDDAGSLDRLRAFGQKLVEEDST
ncbi:MAG: zf-HC2 domain-containing protein [Acidimicrobiales bacterium]|nr:zf-HC2 domain-containing protein [Acidimicrobiales bacterium]